MSVDSNEGRGRFRLTDAVRPPAPTPPQVPLDVVPVSRLVRREQRFACTPYRAVITAGVCCDRQSARVAHRTAGAAATVRYQSCDGCALGATVAKRVGASAAKATKTYAERKHGEGHGARA